MSNKYACSIAAILFALMIAIVFINSMYVKSTADQIILSLENLPEDISESSLMIREISEYWEDRRKILSIALSEPELDLISSLFDEIIIGAQEGNTEEYKKSMARLIRAIKDIRKLEELSLENIF